MHSTNRRAGAKRPASAPFKDSRPASPRIGAHAQQHSQSFARLRSASPSLHTYHAASLHGIAAQNRHELTALQRELTALRTNIIRSRAWSPPPAHPATMQSMAPACSWMRSASPSHAQYAHAEAVSHASPAAAASQPAGYCTTGAMQQEQVCANCTAVAFSLCMLSHRECGAKLKTEP